MGWGEKAIEIRSVETGHLDGVFMHKRAQRLKFLCERNDKVRDESSYSLRTLKAAECKDLAHIHVFYDPPSPQVFFASVRSGGSSQVYFMTLNRNCIMNWWRRFRSGQCVEPFGVRRTKCIRNSRKTHAHNCEHISRYLSSSLSPMQSCSKDTHRQTQTQIISKFIPAYTL